MKRIFITGASRGLGLEFVKQYLHSGNLVIASSRNPQKYKELMELKEEYKEKLVIWKLDVTEEDSRERAFEYVSKEIGKIDLLINNAGIRFGGEKYNDEFGKLRKEDFCNIFLVNTVAPLLMTEKFYPILKKGEESTIVNISSISGCITNRTKKRGGYSYSSSKAALNMITKALSVELLEYGIKVISMHPGWVRTTMEYTENAPLSPKESVEGMIKIINSLRKEDTGKFLNWKGEELPW